MLEKAEIAKTMGEGALGDLTREPVRTLGFIGDYAFSTREPLENNVKD
jgi:hypothetical protein